MKNQAPLDGLRVIEFGQIAAGPFAGSLLADLGADVVKIERPDGGDGMRDWPPLVEENGVPFSENFASLNRNKRSITVDLKNPADVDRLRQLSVKADIIIENFRPGVLGRLGLGYKQLSQINERLIYCSISGYGQTGPYAHKGAFDVTIQAVSGLMSVTGEEGGRPIKCGVPVGDFAAGLYAAYSILAAVYRRESTGLGAYVDCSMLGSLLGIAALQTSEYFGTGTAPRRLGSAHPRNSPYQAYAANDKFFVIAAGNDKLWQSVCEIVGKPDLVTDARFTTQRLRAKHQLELTAILQPLFKKESADFWLAKMDQHGVPCAPIYNYPEILSDPHVSSMGLVRDLVLPNGRKTKTVGFPIQISDFCYETKSPPPHLGAHNEEVWSDWMSA